MSEQLYISPIIYKSFAYEIKCYLDNYIYIYVYIYKYIYICVCVFVCVCVYLYIEYFIVTSAINYLAKGIRRCAGAFVNVKYVPGALV